ncbi:hypothetical protein [uncultured Roseobacter sp.]|uniref:hypothetical protein n=1 Tax=uncultured Roseobacter sp. TaxID=114847 RepID=UPI002606C021|nr:hypothetical protein [uncultured Roseobacter sp.]
MTFQRPSHHVSSNILRVTIALICGTAIAATAVSAQDRSKAQLEPEPMVTDRSVIAGTVGMPMLFTFDPKAVEDGPHELAHDILTGRSLVVTFKNGKSERAFLKVPFSGRIDLKRTTGLNSCSTIHCATTQVPTCFELPEGGCTCVCGGSFKALE